MSSLLSSSFLLLSSFIHHLLYYHWLTSQSTRLLLDLFDRHYGTLADRALKVKPSNLPTPSKKSLNAFQTEYKTSFKDAAATNQLVNVTDYQKSLTTPMAPFELEKEWRSATCIKLFPGTYCAQMNNGKIVVNGFFPAMRAKYEDITLAPNGIQWFIVSWNEKETSWEDFRLKFVGATNPSKAVNGSIRNYMYNNFTELNLNKKPEGSDNGIHASASPIEAAYEIGCVWKPNGSSMKTTSVWKAGIAKNISTSLLTQYITNHNDMSFDLCEHHNLSHCMGLMEAAQTGINSRSNKKQERTERAPWKLNGKSNNNLNGLYVFFLNFF